jgi:hypothetical protein
MSGGLLFAYGNKFYDIINYAGYTYYPAGVAIAWNKEAGNTNCQMYSTDDIFITPESATAYWNKKGFQFGISYANGENTGFIPLDVNVLSVNESNAPKVTVYSNPTTGELSVISYQY